VQIGTGGWTLYGLKINEATPTSTISEAGSQRMAEEEGFDRSHYDGRDLLALVGPLQHEPCKQRICNLPAKTLHFHEPQLTPFL
jgi:hypothetical protein